MLQNKRSAVLMTEGDPKKLILSFAAPIFLSQLFQQLYNTADAWMVSRFLGDDAFAAVSSSGSLIFMVISFFVGASMGAGVVICSLIYIIYYNRSDWLHGFDKKEAFLLSVFCLPNRL